jgi:TonB family protein
MSPRHRRQPPAKLGRIAALVSVLLHLPLLLWFVHSTYLRPAPEASTAPLRISVRPVAPPETTPDDEPPPEADGQIVEIAPPKVEQRPDKADYRAEHDSKVEKESVDPRYRLDRVVTAETYSPEDAYELAQNEGIETDLPFTGTVAGRQVFETGKYSLFPNRTSQWDFDSGEGISAPAPSSALDSRMAGAPSNDYLPGVDRSNKTALNAHKTLYASWWNRVKHLVSFYADQTLSNARPKRALRKHKYEMVLSGLIGPDGHLAAIDVKSGSGVPEFDQALKQAFHLAAPFPPPPEGAADRDGFVHMDSFGFVVMIGSAQAEMNGIDPRQGVQFPGLQTGGR